MYKIFSIIAATIIILGIFIISDKQISFEQEDRNWTIGESDKLTFKYPNNWNVNISNSRFDNYEILFTDQTNNASIRVADEAISTTNKWLYVNNPEGFLNIYMMTNSPLSFYAKKVETYPEGKVTISGIPAYSELYLDQNYAVLISLAFQEGNDRHYIVFSASPSSTYDNIEPIILKIIKSITSKNIQKTSNEEFEISSNNTNPDGESKKKSPSFMTSK